MRTLYFLCLILLLGLGMASGHAQDATPYFTVELEEISVLNAPALHSSAVGQHNGLWVFVTGRTNGLHDLGVNSDAFPDEFANGAVVVYDPMNDQRWTASLDGLADSLADPLRSTNSQFHQAGTVLYVIGGYGTSTAAGEQITFDTLTAFDLPDLIAAVQNGTDLNPHLRQTSDSQLAVTGGHLIEHNGRYHLVGGHRFDGRYLGGASQAYTEAIRSFTLTDDEMALTLSDFTELSDAENLHRRDGNVGPVVYPDGREAFALYGGVFNAATRPYRTPIYVDDGGLTAEAFEAQFGHYTAPLLSLYDADTEAMQTVFFGGMGQFFVEYPGTDSSHVAEDIFVPFIDDVSVLARSSDGTLAEFVLDNVRMPGLLGTNAAYFPNPAVPTYDNGVVMLRELSGRTLVGHIHGGIESDMPNAGLLGGNTWASDRIFAVWITPLVTPSLEDEQPVAFTVSTASPNPFRAQTRLTVTLAEAQPLSVDVFDLIGRRVAQVHDGLLNAGRHTFTLDAQAWPSGIYVARVSGSSGSTTQRLARLR
ncbi:MAG: T9SS type A sorting domain-containing protein [Rhodothermaceae bacterium]|nr:T9SS type A sorting domain-containing protein [Rhodothermaceae bacterium]